MQFAVSKIMPFYFRNAPLFHDLRRRPSAKIVEIIRLAQNAPPLSRYGNGSYNARTAICVHILLPRKRKHLIFLGKNACFERKPTQIVSDRLLRRNVIYFT